MPTRQELADMLNSFEMLKNNTGQLSFRRVEAFNFLKQNDIPVRKQLVDILDAVGTSEIKEQINSSELLSRLDPSGEQLAKQLEEIVAGLGIDLERQLLVNPAEAAATLRAQLAGLALEIINNENFTPEDKQKTKNYGGLLKHSLASAVDSDSIYLLIPFQAEEETKFFQVQFKDERSEDQEDKDTWSVTLKINLSQLGKVVVKTHKREEKVKIKLGAEDPGTVNLLRKNKESLREMLAELGYKPAITCNKLEDGYEDLIEENLMEFAADKLHRLDLEA